jgi:murein DD-endopeptidase MepM/ murein hydrolase activator NlpD
MKTTKVIIGFLSISTLVLGINTYVQQTKLTSSYKKTDSIIQRYNNKIELNESNFDIVLQMRDMEITNLNLALETAFKDNQVIQTLLNQDMVDWTPESVLGMRDKLASLPYGSWFESGHYVTGAFGSKTLSGTYWGKSGHKGVDIKPLNNNPYETIQSAISGRVVTWGRNDKLFGNYLVIESLDGQFQIKLAHLSSIAIFTPEGTYDLYEGMKFEAGDRIARMGNTGNSTGSHLHIEYFMLENDTWRLLNASAILDYIGE